MVVELEEEITTRYIAYLCSPSTELRGRRDTHSNGCLQWSVRRSKTPVRGWKYKMQAKCPACGNRPRIAEHEVYIFDDKETAKTFCERRNAEQPQAIQPNTTEIVDDWNEGWSSGEQ